MAKSSWDRSFWFSDVVVVDDEDDEDDKVGLNVVDCVGWRRILRMEEWCDGVNALLDGMSRRVANTKISFLMETYDI